MRCPRDCDVQLPMRNELVPKLYHYLARKWLGLCLICSHGKARSDWNLKSCNARNMKVILGSTQDMLGKQRTFQAFGPQAMRKSSNLHSYLPQYTSSHYSATVGIDIHKESNNEPLLDLQMVIRKCTPCINCVKKVYKKLKRIIILILYWICTKMCLIRS